MIDLAKRICREKHEGQVGKCGKPYWMHPFAVADAVEGDDAKIVTYLHDVVDPENRGHGTWRLHTQHRLQDRLDYL